VRNLLSVICITPLLCDNYYRDNYIKPDIAISVNSFFRELCELVRVAAPAKGSQETISNKSGTHALFFEWSPDL
jgi:hypothetical protein